MAKTFSSGLQETEFNEYMLVGLGFGLASIVAIGMMIYCRKYKWATSNSGIISF